MSFWKKLFGGRKKPTSAPPLLTPQQNSPQSKVALIPPPTSQATSAGADINAKDANGRTALTKAANNGNLNHVNSLIAGGADVNAKENDGGTALIQASAGGHHEVVQALLANGADVNAKADNEMAALHYASAIGNRRMVNALLDKGADINARGIDGLTPLMLAAAKGHSEVVEALVNNGADIDAKMNNGRTAVLLALQNMHPEITDLLVGRPDITCTTILKSGGTSPLDLPPELNSNERLFDVHAALRKVTKERLKEICRMLPTKDLDLATPGSSEAMKHAVQCTFCVATYVISDGVSKDIADSVIVPLVARIEQIGSAHLHPELGADEVFNLALGLSKSGRAEEALRCLDVLQATVVKLQRPVVFLKYMTLHNAAMDSGAQQDIKRALAYYKATPDLQKESNVVQAVEGLRVKFGTLPPT